jgi:hypothetical protein
MTFDPSQKWRLNDRLAAVAGDTSPARSDGNRFEPSAAIDPQGVVAKIGAVHQVI